MYPLYSRWRSSRQAQILGAFRAAQEGNAALGKQWRVPTSSPGFREKHMPAPLDAPRPRRCCPYPLLPATTRPVPRCRRLSSDTMSTHRMPLAVRSTNWPDTQPQPRGPKGPDAALPLARWSHACLQRDPPRTRLETTPFLYGHGTAREQCPVCMITPRSAGFPLAGTTAALCRWPPGREDAPKYAPRTCGSGHG